MIAPTIDTLEATFRVARHFEPYKNVVVPNVTGLTGWDCDLFVVRPSGWCEEIEIKVSVADFRREFTSPTKVIKHRLLQEGIPREELFGKVKPISLGGAVWTIKNDPGRVIWGETSPHLVRRYWIAVPESIVGKVRESVPEYAGLFSIPEGEFGRTAVQEIKPAQNLRHSRKLETIETDAVLTCAYYRYHDLARTHRELRTRSGSK